MKRHGGKEALQLRHVPDPARDARPVASVIDNSSTANANSRWGTRTIPLGSIVPYTRKLPWLLPQKKALVTRDSLSWVRDNAPTRLVPGRGIPKQSPFTGNRHGHRKFYAHMPVPGACVPNSAEKRARLADEGPFPDPQGNHSPTRNMDGNR